MELTTFLPFQFLCRILSATSSSWPLICFRPEWLRPRVESGELYFRQFFRTSTTATICSIRPFYSGDNWGFGLLQSSYRVKTSTPQNILSRCGWNIPSRRRYERGWYGSKLGRGTILSDRLLVTVGQCLLIAVHNLITIASQNGV